MSCEPPERNKYMTADSSEVENRQCLPVIQAKGLGKRYLMYEKPLDRLKQAMWGKRKQYYQEFWALRGINMNIMRGESVGIIGKNGSGKSTLLQLICKTLEPSEGDIAVQGRVAALLELGSGFNPEFTGIENVYMNATLLGLTRKQIDERLDSMLAFADIGDFAMRTVKSYSSGMQVRLAFSVIAHVDADILICDEALAVGDAIFTQRCMRFIKEFQDHGTLLFVSHDMGSVAALTNRCIWINQGQLCFDGISRTGLRLYMEFCQHESGYRNLPATQIDQKDEQPLAESSPEDLNLGIPSREDIDGWQRHIRRIAFEQATNLSRGAPMDDHCDGIARIESWAMIGRSGRETKTPQAGELVDLVVCCKAAQNLRLPFVGFQVVDRRGLILFGENTAGLKKTEEIIVESGLRFYAVFQLVWPQLSPGDYGINLAVSTGTFSEHKNHHWINDSFIVTVLESERMVNGIFSPEVTSSHWDVY